MQNDYGGTYAFLVVSLLQLGKTALMFSFHFSLPENVLANNNNKKDH